MNPPTSQLQVYEPIFTGTATLIPLALMTFTLVICANLKDQQTGPPEWRPVRWSSLRVLVPLLFFHLLCAAALWHWISRVSAVISGCCALAVLVLMVYCIRRDRYQWTIKTLLLITFLTAVSCGLLRWQGWAMVPVLLVFLSLAVLWQAIILWHRSRPNKASDDIEGES